MMRSYASGTAGGMRKALRCEPPLISIHPLVPLSTQTGEITKSHFLLIEFEHPGGSLGYVTSQQWASGNSTTRALSLCDFRQQTALAHSVRKATS